MNILRAAAFAALFLCSETPFAPAFANDVTLTSRDGAISISGNLLGFDGEFYRVDSEFGVLTVDGSGVNCEGPGCPGLGAYVAEFTLSGARSMGEVLMPALIEGFARNGGFAVSREELQGVGLLYSLYDGDSDTAVARITLRLTSSAEGFADLVGEEADMVLSLREASPGERNMAREAGLGDLRGPRQSRVIALDALVPVVSPENPLRQLTLPNLESLYAGEIPRWSELGGEDAPVTLYLRDPESDFGGLFAQRVMAPAGKALGDGVLAQGSNRGLARAVAEDPFGLGIASFSQLGMTEPLTLTGDCGFDLAASQGSVKAGDYPLTTPLYLYLPARRLPKLARDFLVYLRGDSAQQVIRRAGFIDQGLTEIPLDAQGSRLTNAIRAAGPEVSLEELQRMAALFTTNHRLTLTFRFKDGSAALDAPSYSNIGLLAAALESGRFDGRKITFVGFTDGQGKAEVNLRLAERRAQAVLDAVLEEAEAFDPAAVELATDAFGEALPMACDDTAWGRRVNRRVEIWVD